MPKKTRGGDYKVLLKDKPGGFYSGVRVVEGREQALELMRRLKAERPGSYLLLNLKTNMIEDDVD